MKTYIVYVRGVEQSEYVKAEGHNQAETKAQRKYMAKDSTLKPHEVSVAYTEI
jgi:hypothetical protein